MKLNKQIGISTLSLRNIPLLDTMDMVIKSGLKIIEIVPRLYGGPRNLSPRLRKQIRDKTKFFEIITIHTSSPSFPDNQPVNIASSDPVLRRESIEHYLDHIRLAFDIDASVVTFHPGMEDELSSPEQTQEANLSFARRALSLANETQLKMGFENFDLKLAQMIGNDQFGILFDIGHAGMEARENITDEINKLMNLLAPYIVQLHLHGINIAKDGKREDHVNFKNNNGIDYRKVLFGVKKIGFDGPFVFEIGIRNEQGAYEHLNETLFASEQIKEFWQE